MKSSNFIEGVLLGAIVGLTAGILLAPDKGTETRRKLMEKGDDLAKSVKNKFSKYGGGEEGEDMLDEAGNKVEDWARKGKKKGKDMVDQAENKAEEWQDKATNSF